MTNNTPPLGMAEILGEVIEDVAQAIEEQLGHMDSLTAQGGPYETSQKLTYQKKLREAAAAALATVVNHPKLRPQEAANTNGD